MLQCFMQISYMKIPNLEKTQRVSTLGTYLNKNKISYVIEFNFSWQIFEIKKERK